MHTFDSNFKPEVLLAPATRGSTNSSWVAAFTEGNNRAVVALNVGTTVQAISFKLTQAQDASGTGAKDITGAALASITTANDNTYNTIDIGPGALDGADGFTFIRAEMTIASAGTTPTDVVLYRYDLRRAGEGAQDATYAQQVIVLG